MLTEKPEAGNCFEALEAFNSYFHDMPTSFLYVPDRP